MIQTSNKALGRLICPQQSREIDGGIVFAVTEFSEDGWRSSGELTIKTKDPNFEFWKWLHLNRQILPPVLDEIFVPALMNYAAGMPPAAVLKVASNGVYLNCESNGPFVAEAIDALVASVGDSAITTFQPSAATTAAHKLMSVFCRGLAEVFVFQEGRCSFFGAIGQDRAGIAMNVSLIAKRTPPTPELPPSTPRG